MFIHILVPLDGSRLAESVLPAAAAIAKLVAASVTLVHVIEKNAPREIHGEMHLSEPEEAEAYLSEIAKKAFPTDTKINYHVHITEVENVAAGIAQHIGELDADLVIMSTHGHGGIRDLFFGNIAQEVIALGKTPVLLIPPNREDGKPSSFNCHRILVPLDGQSEHEIGLLKAAEFSKMCAAQLHLLFVVPTRETLPGKMAAKRLMMPGATAEMLDMEVQDAEDYLLKLREPFEKDGLNVTCQVLRGDPASIIVETARNIHADIIVLGTHAKYGINAFWDESVAPKISNQCKLPLFFIPLKKKDKIVNRNI